MDEKPGGAERDAAYVDLTPKSYIKKGRKVGRSSNKCMATKTNMKINEFFSPQTTADD